MSNVDPKLVEFALNQLGGLEEVTKQFHSGRIKEVLRSGWSLGKIVETATKEKWVDELNEMTIPEIVTMIRGTSSKKASTTGRITKEQRQNIMDAVLITLKDNPWISKGAIADAVGVEATKLNGIIKELKDDNKVKTHGAMRNMVYALVGTKNRPE